MELTDFQNTIKQYQEQGNKKVINNIFNYVNEDLFVYRENKVEI
jgi:hypothetical protein